MLLLRGLCTSRRAKEPDDQAGVEGKLGHGLPMYWHSVRMVPRLSLEELEEKLNTKTQGLEIYVPGRFARSSLEMAKYMDRLPLVWALCKLLFIPA